MRANSRRVADSSTSSGGLSICSKYSLGSWVLTWRWPPAGCGCWDTPRGMHLNPHERGVHPNVFCVSWSKTMALQSLRVIQKHACSLGITPPDLTSINKQVRQMTMVCHKPPPPPCVTFRRVVAPLRGPGQSPVLPFACCAGSLRSVGRCGRCSCWCRFRVRGAQ